MDEALALRLYEIGAIKFGEFELKSGRVSPVYVDLRILVSHPAALRQAGDAIATALGALRFDRISGIPYAGLPIGIAAALAGNYPLCYGRKEPKQYGTHQRIEGEHHSGERVVLIDDVITDGGAKIEAADLFREAGLIVEDVLVIVDREQGGDQQLAAAGLRLRRVYTLRQLLSILRDAGRVPAETVESTLRYLESG